MAPHITIQNYIILLQKVSKGPIQRDLGLHPAGAGGYFGGARVGKIGLVLDDEEGSGGRSVSFQTIVATGILMYRLDLLGVSITVPIPSGNMSSESTRRYMAAEAPVLQPICHFIFCAMQ